jgi:putative hydrolase of the HAD superfamily
MIKAIIFDFFEVLYIAEQPNEELLAYIEKLKNNYKTAILSNADIGSLERRLGADRLEKYFDERVISAEVGIMKPDPKIYLMVSDRLSLRPEECIFIDDMDKHCEGAEAVGMKTVQYINFSQMKSDLEKMLANSASTDN